MKKMYHIMKLSVIAGIVMILYSCELEEYNPSGVTAEAIWSTPEGFETLVAAAYSIQRDYYGKENAIFMNESGTDLWFNASYKSYANEYSRYEGLSAIGGNYHGDTWKKMYEAANLANIGIEQVEEVDWPSQEKKNAIKAEMHFLRAWYYWHIVEFFGGVTLHKEAIKSVVLTAERSPVEDFYDMIIEDLQFAVENLPYDQGAQYSRATKKSALGLLARAALSGAYQDESKRDEYFTIARDAAKELIDNQVIYGVELWEDAADIYDPDNNKQNKEACYIASNSFNDELNIKYGNRAFWYWTFKYYDLPGMTRSSEYGRGSDRFMPTLAMLDFYDESIDARYEAFFREEWYCNNEETIPVWTLEELTENGLDTSLVDQPKFGLGDTAVWVTKKSISDEGKRPYMVVDRDYIYLTTTTNGINPAQSNYFPTLKKFDDPFRDDPENRYGHLDVILIRLAEIYLIAAEAELQLGNISTAADYINVIRTRAAKPGFETDMQITADSVTIDFILDERARELAGEGMRWLDLKRTGKLMEYTRLRNPDIRNLVDSGIDPFLGANGNYKILRPIPLSAIALDSGEYPQNPAYQ